MGTGMGVSSEVVRLLVIDRFPRLQNAQLPAQLLRVYVPRNEAVPADVDDVVVPQLAGRPAAAVRLELLVFMGQLAVNALDQRPYGHGNLRGLRHGSPLSTVFGGTFRH